MKNLFSPFNLPTVLLLIFTVFMAGCQTIPWPWISNENNLQQSQPDISLIKKRYDSDQQHRRAIPANWQIQGVLDVEHPELGRRSRLSIIKTPDQQISLRLYGLFQQVAFDLRVDPVWLQLIQPHSREIIRLQSTRAGLAYLTGYNLDPQQLPHLFLGQAAPLSTRPKQIEQGLFTSTQEGEHLLLDAKTGRIEQRWQNDEQGMLYEVRYQWPIPEKNHPYSLPERVSISLEKDNLTINFLFRKWLFPEPGHAFKLPQLPKGFQMIQPQFEPMNDGHGSS
ncbi:MAG: hypothetical protein HQL67_02425 [Magnetococcales bacterium]|nr:hypothetical protein [Magnetococcales bacterium]